METFGTDDSSNKYGKAAQATAEKAADRVQGGIKNAQQAANAAGSAISNKVEGLRSSVAPAMHKAADQVEGMAKQGMEAGAQAAQQAREYAAQTSDSIVKFTKENPVKALMLAVAGGALLATLIKVLSPSRD